MAKQSLQQKLDALIEQLTPVIRNAFFAAIEGITSEVVLADLIKRIQANDIEGAFRSLGMSQAAMRPLTAALEAAFERGGGVVGSSFPARVQSYYGQTIFRFDVRNIRAEDWLREQSSRLITNITEDVRTNVRTIMQQGLSVGANPKVTALDIVGRVDPTTGRRMGGIIGLTNNQEQWVQNARSDLASLSENYFNRKRRDKRFDRIVAKAIKEGKPLDDATINKLITRYKDSLLKLRGETIGRTETIASLNRAQFEAYQQAIELGATKAGDVSKVWDSAGDARVRHDHRVMDGQRVNVNEAFVAPDGSKLMFPGDTSLGASAKEVINCRCRTRFSVDWLADLD